MKFYLSKQMALLAVGLGVLAGCGGGNGTSSLSTTGGGTLIYVESPVPFVGDPESDAELFAVDSTGKNVRRLTTNTSQDREPSVTRDGRTIVWSVMPKGADSPEIHIMNSDGSNSRRLYPRGQFPTISPDGKLVAFVLGPFICTIKPDGSDFRSLNAPQFQQFFVNQPISFSSDGKRIAFGDEARKPGIYTVASDGSDLQTVALSSSKQFYREGVSYGPNDEIVSGVRVRSDNGPEQSGLFIVRDDGTTGRIIGLGNERPVGPVWSPSGKEIAYSESPLSNNTPRTFGIIIRSADGSSRRVIDGNGFEATWGG
ncbi:MAG TPA: hypothetical protein VF681_08850 [Abditibacteriaceae bacterium]|jgi:hypothetical protein